MSGPEAQFPPAEELVDLAPLVIRRRVLFGECDPAGVVYTPRFADYLRSAHLWTVRVLGGGADICFPVRGLELDFRRSLAPGDVFDMTCSIGLVRSRSYDLLVRATVDEDVVFLGGISPIAVDPASRRASPSRPAIARVWRAIAKHTQGEGRGSLVHLGRPNRLLLIIYSSTKIVPRYSVQYCWIRGGLLPSDSVAASGGTAYRLPSWNIRAYRNPP